jgi:hypothetical protein
MPESRIPRPSPDSEFVNSLQWSPTLAADYRAAIPAHERVSHFRRASRAIKGLTFAVLWFDHLPP